MKEALGYKLILAFAGAEAPERIRKWVAERPLAGFTHFRPLNVKSSAQVRALTAELQTLVAQNGRPPLLFAVDQEGGQLVALGTDSTHFPGNMALAAARDADLTYRVGRAIGREMAAMGVHINYAPDCDINTTPHNPAAGIRTFGDDPALAAEMAGAMVSGLQLAFGRGLIEDHHIEKSVARIMALKQWVGQQTQPPLDVVGCAEHRALEAEAARRSLTLVRDTVQRLPLRLPESAGIAVIILEPSMQALAAGLWGEMPFVGTLPVKLAVAA